MSQTHIDGIRIAGISTCTPSHVVNNLDLGDQFGADEVRKIVAMAGIKHRPVVQGNTTAGDLCLQAATELLAKLGWAAETITALIFVTQSPDHFLPSTSCLLHHKLGLGDHCATFDVGMGCSGYPYGLYLASTMLHAGGHQRVLMLNGDTPSRFVSPDDHTTSLLFSDAGSATALESNTQAAPSTFCLHTDGAGAHSISMQGGGFRNRFPQDPRDYFVRMDGAAVFNFTLKRVPPLIESTLARAGKTILEVDWYFFHQSNRFIMKHLIKKCGLPEERVPLCIENFGNCGGPSVALAATQALIDKPRQPAHVMMLGYGVGLSWASALVPIDAQTEILHSTYRLTV
jgi:3-oxoacyl-[acyl-carrier-protein] synthase III